MYLNSLKAHVPAPKGAHWLKRLGFAGFSFFLVKGLAWLLIPWLLHSVL